MQNVTVNLESVTPLFIGEEMLYWLRVGATL